MRYFLVIHIIVLASTIREIEKNYGKSNRNICQLFNFYDPFEMYYEKKFHTSIKEPQNKIKIDCSLIVLLQNVALSTHVRSTLTYSSFVPSSARLHSFSISYSVTKTWRFHVLGARCWYNTTLLFNTSPCHVHKCCF